MKKIALITGGSRGLGRDMAFQLAKQGRDIIITYRIEQAKAENVLNELKELGAKAVALQLDVEKADTFDGFVQSVADSLTNDFAGAKLDFLVNNAGIGIHSMINATTEPELDQLFNIHFKGPYLLTQKLLDLINDGGAIVNISTGLARFSSPGYAAYASMKSAIETFSRYSALELGSRRIRVNVVAPGAIKTDFTADFFRNVPNAEAYISGNTALGRVGEATDIGGVVAFLCSDDAKWVNGQRIEVTGGVFL